MSRLPPHTAYINGVYPLNRNMIYNTGFIDIASCMLLSFTEKLYIGVQLVLITFITKYALNMKTIQQKYRLKILKYTILKFIGNIYFLLLKVKNKQFLPNKIEDQELTIVGFDIHISSMSDKELNNVKMSFLCSINQWSPSFKYKHDIKIQDLQIQLLVIYVIVLYRETLSLCLFNG